MTNKKAIDLIDDKVEELKTIISSLKVNETLSNSTRGTQLYAKGRDRRVLNLIKALVKQIPSDVELSEKDMDTFTLITCLASERVARSSVVINEGDKLMDVLQKYAAVKDIARKIQVQCEKLGLHIDYTTGTISK